MGYSSIRFVTFSERPVLRPVMTTSSPMSSYVSLPVASMKPCSSTEKGGTSSSRPATPGSLINTKGTEEVDRHMMSSQLILPPTTGCTLAFIGGLERIVLIRVHPGILNGQERDEQCKQPVTYR
ncbi:hypothetical protein AcV5_002237 [Taiwanofungus camphoratus]|nr:hypothetical protein AcV5_002237 [Antrodia cinnamomea]KAI0944116.1 hypothetical protein AcV7_002027 [Antrodia cinnamomea]